ncbi:hypothetical protein ACSBR2_033081 [Camellia fascicularis]
MTSSNEMIVGVVGAKDLPAKPSEEEFKFGLRSDLILCNVLNKVQSRAVPNVVESPWDSSLIPDGAALSIYQYFENVRIFLVAAQELGLPTFEASDLEQGGKSARVVICVLALKSYNDWKQTGANGVWKFGGNLKTVASGNHFMRKNSEPFTGSLTRNLSMGEKSLNAITADLNSNNKCSSSLSMLVRAILLDKKPEEVPTKKTSKDVIVSLGNKSLLKHGSGDIQVEEKNLMRVKKEECSHRNHVPDEESEKQFLKQKMIFEQHNRDIIELKQTIHTTKDSMQFMQMKFHKDIHNVDVSLVRVTSTSDVIDLMNLGKKNHAVGAIALNDHSNRSHGFLTVHVQGRDLTSGTIVHSCMHLVDPARSERVDKSEVIGDRLKEAEHINKSLFALGDVISSLAQKNSHVPYRNSKITQLLQDSLRGQAKTLMFVHINPKLDAVEETISTLKFAKRVATIELSAACVNKNSVDVKELKEQVLPLSLIA